METERETGTRDVMFNLISVLYHALDAAETCARYRADAEEDGEQELVEIFDEVIAKNREIADRVKGVLGERMGEVERSSMDSGERESGVTAH